jgi:tRNA-Thr(GGU) m(6)t(6)A37 methyltransferase TsaA
MAQEPPDSHTLRIEPIGVVRNAVKRPSRQRWESVVSEIVLNDGLEEALDGLEEFSHLMVIYWMHRVSPVERLITKVRPRRRPELPLVGTFASRSPARPNPLGVATVKLLERRGGILRVVGLDAIDGTPVLDVKPYIPGYDSAEEAHIPGWMRTLSFAPSEAWEDG